MIKNRSVLFLAGLISVFTSCKNDDIKVSLDEVVLNHKNSGSFSATITNSENTPYVGKEVQLFDAGELIDEVTTDDLGVADFSKVNEGNYTLKGEEYEEGGVKYSFSRTIQIVTGEEKNVTITPSRYSGKVTISVFEQHQIESQTYSDLTEQYGGNVALFVPNATTNFSKLASIKDAIVAEKKLLDDANEVSFEKLPIGLYYVLYYTDDTHFQVLTYYAYSNYNDPALSYYNEVYITKDADYKVEITVGGENFNDYSGDVTISVFEYFQFNYSAQTNPEPLINGKVALINGSLSSNATFEDFQNKIVVEKTLDGTTNKLMFNDVKVGNYSVVVYTDESHFDIAKLGYFQYSSSYFFLGQDKAIEKDAIVNAVNIREIVFNQSFYVYNYIYDSNYNYVQQGIQGVSVFVLLRNTYDDLDYSYRSNKSIIEKFALNSGVTDENGLLSLSVDGYKNNQVIYFNQAGEYMSSSTIFVTDESSQISYNAY